MTPGATEPMISSLARDGGAYKTWGFAKGRFRDSPVHWIIWLNLQSSIVATAFDGPCSEYNRLVQFVKYHLWSASSANVICPSAMQDGAAAVLKHQLTRGIHDAETRSVLEDAVRRLTSRDPAMGWTSGQWMTERKGGSNVSGTETIATLVGCTDEKSAGGLPLGPWRIDGFKWFSSATDCSMAILLAQTQKGLSCFFAPTRRLVNGCEEMNGIRIQKLKSKMGTRSLPTAELELEGMRGRLLGKEGKGVKVISGMLNITRIHNSGQSIYANLIMPLIGGSDRSRVARKRSSNC